MERGRGNRPRTGTRAGATVSKPVPGKRTLVPTSVPRAVVQRKATPAPARRDVETAAIPEADATHPGLDGPPDAIAEADAATGSAGAAPDVHAAAAAGVSGPAGELPHLEPIQRAFGRHDVGGIGAHVGGHAVAAAGQIGAQAYAVADQVAFAGTPDLHTAAHEAAHVVQQRAGVALLGGVGAEGDPHERHADRVADAVVAGGSAEGILDEMAPPGAPAAATTPAVQRRPGALQLVNAAMYLHLNARDAAAGVMRHLDGVKLLAPHPRLSWRDPAAFRRGLVAQLDRLLFQFAVPRELRQVLHPRDPYAVVDRLRSIAGTAPGLPGNPLVGGPVGPDEWRPSVGAALGQLFQGAVVASLARMGPRYLAAADHYANLAAPGTSAAGVHYIDYDTLPLSHHMDRAVGWSICRSAVFEIAPAPDTRAASDKKAKPGADDAAAEPAPRHALRPVKLAWQGERAPELWNWVRVSEPLDATAEEVAAELFAYTAKDYGESNTSFLAYAITAAPPLFGIPASWAMKNPEAAAHAPKRPGVVDDHGHGHLLALASNATVGDELALIEASRRATADGNATGKNDAPAMTQVAAGELIGDCLTQAGYLHTTLAPWRLAFPVGKALEFLTRKLAETAHDPAAAATWGPVLTAQKATLAKIGGAVTQLDRAAATLGLDDKLGAAAEPLREILVIYAEAAAISHLADTSRGLIARAAAERARLPLHSVQGSTHGMDAAIDMMRDSTPLGDDDRQRMVERQAELDDQSSALQGRMLAGDKVTADEIDKLTLRTDMLALRARVHAITTQLGVLEQSAREGNDSLAENFASLFSGDFRSLEGATTALRSAVTSVVQTMDFTMDTENLGFSFEYGTIEEYDQAQHATRRRALAAAQAAFAAIAERTDIGTFLREGGELVKWQAFRTACVKVAALVGISIVGGALGGALARGAGGLLVRAGAPAVLARLGGGAVGLGVDSAVAGTGQALIFGDHLDDAILENLLTGLGSMGILKLIAKNADEVAKIEQATRGFWRRAAKGGKIVLVETAAITGHAVMGAALGYVAHKIVTGKTQPPPATLEEWLLQGASIAVGRHVGKSLEARLGGYKQLSRIKGFDPAKRLGDVAVQLKAQAEVLEVRPDAPTALELMNRRHELLMTELEVLDTLLSRPELLRKHAVTADEIRAMRGELNAWLDDVHLQGCAEISLHLAGLHELVPGAVWKGTREQIELAVRSVERQGGEVQASRDAASGKWKVILDGKPMVVHERTAPAADAAVAARSGAAGDDAAAAAADYKPVTIEPDAGHGERAITSDLVPGSAFKGRAEAHVDFAAEQAHAARLGTEVAAILPNLTGLVPGVQAIQRAGNLYVVTLDSGVRSTVEVIVGPLPGHAVALAVVNPTKRGRTTVNGDSLDIHGRHVIELSVGLHPDQVERAIAGQLGSIVAAQDALYGGRHPARGVLHPERAPGALGASDVGRIAELNVLASQLDKVRTLAPDRAAAIEHELGALVEHLGIRNGTDGAEARMDALRPHLRGQALDTIERARRGAHDGTPAEQAARARLIEDIETAAWDDLHAVHGQRGPDSVHAPPPSLAPRGQVADLAKIQDAARMAARLREMVSAKTLQAYRQRVRDARPGDYVEVADLQLGGGAALAGRRPSALLVDSRGRWQADGAAQIAQTTHQLDQLRDAGLGDPREVAGPDQRVPLEAVRYWEDSIAAQGDVINGTATFRTADDGTLLVEIRPVDGSPALTLKVGGTPTIATGFPSERAPGSPFGITVVDSILHLEKQLERIATAPDAPPAAARALTELRKLKGESVLNAAVADRLLGNPSDPESAALRQALGSDETTTMALQALDAGRHWIDLKNADRGNHVFLGDQANLASIGAAATARDAPRSWVIAGRAGPRSARPRSSWREPRTPIRPSR